MKRIVVTILSLALLGACSNKPQLVKDQTEAINDSTDKESEEIAEETFESTGIDTLSAKD